MTVALSLVTLVAAVALQAAPQEGVERPRIGLALSGGGARGMAHVGVLRWFEEHRIPVDFIAGTSMGGLMGGLYAIGMTPDALAVLVETTDWDTVLAGSPPYPDLAFRRKEDEREFATALEFGFRDGIRIPRGLNEGHAVGLILDRETLPYDSLDSFDDLPIPFRTLATDLVEGRLVVFERGPLPEALRATMALPGIFTPLDSGDAVYADGGLLNNIPTDVVGGMGADIVIAVDVGTPLAGREQLDGLLEILSQSVAVMGIESDRRNLELADIVIVPELEGYTRLDFGDPAGVVEAGYRAAEGEAPALERLALDPDAWERYLEDRRSRRRTSVPVPRSVEVDAPDPFAVRGIAERLRDHLGQPLDTGALERDLTRMVGDGRFASLGYRMTPDGLLRIEARSKSHGPPFGRIGLDVDAATNGLLDVSAGGRLTFMDLGGAGAEWRTDLKVGIQDVAATEYFRPVGGSRWFVAARAWWHAATEGLFESGSRIAELRSRHKGAGLDVGYSLGGSSEIRAGYELRGASASIQTGDPLFPEREGGFRSAFLRWAYDGHDRPVIPTRGIGARLETRWFSEEPELVADLVRSELEVSVFQPVSSRGSVFGTLGGGETFLRDPLPVQQFTLGGTARLSAWNRGEFRDGRFALASVGYLHDLGALPPVVGDRLYATAFYEAGRLWSPSNPHGVLQDFALAFGTRSPLGALWLGGAWGEGGETKVFFRIGRLF